MHPSWEAQPLPYLVATNRQEAPFPLAGSLYLHFENAVYFSHCPAVGALKKDCLAVFKESKKISLEDTRQTFIGRLFDSVLRVFETLL